MNVVLEYYLKVFLNFLLLNLRRVENRDLRFVRSIVDEIIRIAIRLIGVRKQNPFILNVLGSRCSNARGQDESALVERHGKLWRKVMAIAEIFHRLREPV